jgi:hypothetical protein
MTVRTHVYSILMSTAEALCVVEQYLIDHPDLDPDDVLFDDVNAAIRALIPIMQSICAEPKLPPIVRNFLAQL